MVIEIDAKHEKQNKLGYKVATLIYTFSFLSLSMFLFFTMNYFLVQDVIDNIANEYLYIGVYAFRVLVFVQFLFIPLFFAKRLGRKLKKLERIESWMTTDKHN